MLIEQAFSSYFTTIIHANFYLFLFLKSVVSIFFKLLKAKKKTFAQKKEGGGGVSK